MTTHAFPAPRRGDVAALAVAALAACTSSAYEATPLPRRRPPPPTPSAPPRPRRPRPARTRCSRTRPPATVPDGPAGGPTVDDDPRARRGCVVGVSADTLLLGARNPLSAGRSRASTSTCRGRSRRRSSATPTRSQFRVITSASGSRCCRTTSVDLVARAMTINCDALGADRVLRRVLPGRPEGAGHPGTPRRPRSRTWAASASAPRPGRRAWTSSRPSRTSRRSPPPTHTGCLVMFQQGKVGRDHRRRHGAGRVRRAGPVRQGRRRRVQRRAVRHRRQRQTRSTWSGSSTRVLDQAKADGTWTASYNRWLAAALGPAPAPADPGVRPLMPDHARPTAPGRPGQARGARPRTATAALPRAGSRRGATRRRAELDRLDQAALQASPTPDALHRDVAAALAMWQAIRHPYDELVEVWDSGRVDAVEREKMSQLVWGRLDAGAVGGRALVVAGPRPCRLSRRDDLPGARAAVVRPGRPPTRPPGCAACGPGWAVRGPGRREPDRAARDAAAHRCGALEQRLDELTEPARGAPTSAARWARWRPRRRCAERDLIVQVPPRRRDDERDRRAGHDLRERCGPARADAAPSWPTGARRRSRTRRGSPCRRCHALGAVPGHARGARRVRRPAARPSAGRSSRGRRVQRAAAERAELR